MPPDDSEGGFLSTNNDAFFAKEKLEVFDSVDEVEFETSEAAGSVVITDALVMKGDSMLYLISL